MCIRDRNKLGNALLGFIQELTEADVRQQETAKKQGIKNPILVLTATVEAQTYLSAFFQETNFTNVVVQLQANAPTAIIGYDLVIFDNRDLAECPKSFLLNKLALPEQTAILERIALMDTLKANTTCLFIHFGEFLYWVSENRERVHAANSKFSLFARSKEMIDFINTYRV